MVEHCFLLVQAFLSGRPDDVVSVFSRTGPSDVVLLLRGLHLSTQNLTLELYRQYLIARVRPVKNCRFGFLGKSFQV